MPETLNPWVGKITFLGNLMDRGAWWDIVHGVAKSWMTEQLSTHTHPQYNHRREGTQRQGRNSQKKPRIHITISLGYVADTETPTRWEKLTVGFPQAYRPQTFWKQVVDDVDSQLSHHQPVRRMSFSWSCPPWTIPVKLLTTPSKLACSFEGTSPLWVCLA